MFESFTFLISGSSRFHWKLIFKTCAALRFSSLLSLLFEEKKRKGKAPIFMFSRVVFRVIVTAPRGKRPAGTLAIAYGVPESPRRGWPPSAGKRRHFDGRALFCSSCLTVLTAHLPVSFVLLFLFFVLQSQIFSKYRPKTG